MAKFMAALIRFTLDGQSYPVNCADPTIRPGDQVLVRMTSQANSLQKAEVVETILSPVECKNSVVCRQERADDYGDGPFGVEDEPTLEGFLSFLGYTRFSTLWAETSWTPNADEDWNSEFIANCDQWPTAYVQFASSMYGSKDEVRGANRIVLIGRSGLARTSWGDGVWGGSSAYFRNEKLVLREIDRRLDFDSSDGNPYRQAAEWAEELVWADFSDEPDDTQAQIRRAINGGTGGAAYLSDGVWL